MPASSMPGMKSSQFAWHDSSLATAMRVDYALHYPIVNEVSILYFFAAIIFSTICKTRQLIEKKKLRAGMIVYVAGVVGDATHQASNTPGVGAHSREPAS